MARLEDFDYREPTEKTRRRHESENRGITDPFAKDQVVLYRPREGKNRVRLLPPTWKVGEWVSFQVWIHYDVGLDSGAYLCLRKMKDEPCPVCEELDQANREDEEYVRALSPTLRWAAWILDRRASDPEPQLWLMPATVDRELLAIIKDTDSGEHISLADPRKAYDVEFTKEGVGMRTKYVNIRLARAATKLLEDRQEADRVLNHVMKNPVPDCFIYYDYDRIAKMFSGHIGVRNKSLRGRDRDRDDDADRRGRGKGGRDRDRERDDDDDRAGRRSARREIDNEDDEDRARGRDRDDRDDDDERPQRRGSARENDDDARPARAGRDRDRDDDDGDEREQPRARPREDDDDDQDTRRPRRRAAGNDDSDRDDDDDDDARSGDRGRSRRRGLSRR